MAPLASGVPLSLCSVCRRWRQVVTKDPVLWSTIKLGKRHSAQFISTWLSRAATLPIGVSLVLEPSGFRSRKSHKHFDVVVPLSRRLQFLELRVLPGATFRLLENLSSAALPSLEVLNISHEGDVWAYSVSPFGNVFHSAPRLHSVDIWGVRADPLSMDFPWSQLTRFASDAYLSVNSCYRLLDRLPKLQSGYFKIRQGQGIPQNSMKRLSLPDLRALELSVASNMEDLLAGLRLPAIRFLWIEFVHAAGWALTNFVSSIAPFSLNLHTLQLFGPPISETDIIQCLLTMPSLVVLVLRDHPNFGFISDRLITLLTYGGCDQMFLCSGLETLRLSSVFACQDGRIADMVESRWWLVCVSHII